jgi:hypothetical protein
LLNLWSSTNGQQEISVSAARYGITRILAPGASLYVYDPEFGLVNTSNQVHHQGIMTYPASVRVLGVRWPVEQGMAVLLRYYSGGSYVYLDLTDYVEFESGSAQLEVSWNQRSLGGEFQPASPRTEQYEAGAWASYTPSWTVSGGGAALGNGTVSGRYRRQGTTVHIQQRLTIGSTSTLGTGAVRLSLPSGMTGGALASTGSGFWLDASTGILTPAVSILDAGVGYIYGWIGTGASPGDSAGLGTGDVIHYGATVEIAP